MLKTMFLAVMALGTLSGCVVYTPVHPYRAAVVVAAPTPGYVEVVPVRPYPTAVWIGGGWGYYHHQRFYHRGYWR